MLVTMLTVPNRAYVEKNLLYTKYLI